MSESDDELGPIGGLVLSVLFVGFGLFMTTAENYVLAIGPVNTGIGIPIVGWIVVLFGVLGLLGNGMEFREEYLGGGDASRGGRRPVGENYQQRGVQQQGHPQGAQRGQPQSEQPEQHGQPSVSRQQSGTGGAQQPGRPQRTQPHQQASANQPQQTPKNQVQQSGPQRDRPQQDQPGGPEQPTGDRSSFNCPQCQAPVSAGAAHCPNCGTRLQ